MEYRSPREREKRGQKIRGYAMMVAALLAAGGIGWYVFIGSGDKSLGENLCPVEEGPSAIHVVIVDATDPYNPVQWQNVKNRLAAIKEEIPKHGLLAIFPVTKSVPKTLEPEIELCNPGSGDRLNVWTGNPELARRRWERSFTAPIDSIFAGIKAEEPRARSPIMETIQAARARVGAYDTDKQNLIIISDMMQHTRQYSHYGGGPPDYDRFESTAPEQKLSTDLSGWNVKIHYARRGGAEREVQGREHIDFWDRYFLENGARLQRVRRIDG